MKTGHRLVAFKWLVAWLLCLALVACHMIVPGGPASFNAPTLMVRPTIAKPTAIRTVRPNSATQTPTFAVIPSSTFAPTVTVQPVPQVLTPANLSRLKFIARRDFASNELITALAWSPDGSRLAVAAGQQIHWLDGSSLKEIRLLSIGAFSRSLSFSPDGVWLAAGSQDGLVRLWRTQTLDQPASSLDPVYNLPAHKKGVNQVAFDPAQPLLASGGNDAVTRIWDLNSGKQVNQIVGGTFAVPGLAFSPDGVFLAVMNGSVIRLRDAVSGRMYATLRVDSNLFSLAFSPSGDSLAAGDNAGALWVWPEASFKSGGNETLQPLHLDSGVVISGQKGLVWQVAFSPDGNLLGAALGDGSLQIWDAHSGEKFWSAQLADSAVTSLAFHPGGAWLATGGLNASLQVWDLAP
jgi:WD40 repeat protein